MVVKRKRVGPVDEERVVVKEKEQKVKKPSTCIETIENRISSQENVNDGDFKLIEIQNK